MGQKQKQECEIANHHHFIVKCMPIFFPKVHHKQDSYYHHNSYSIGGSLLEIESHFPKVMMQDFH